MSKERAFSNPASAAMRAAPTTPAAGPESSANAACAAASSSVATPPDERMTSGTGSPASRQDVARAPQVAGEHGPEVGVDRRRRGALVLPELGRDLVGCDDVRLRVSPPQLLGDGALVRRVAEGEEEARRRSRRHRRRAASRERAARARRRGRSALHADAALERDERSWMLRAGPVQVRSRLAAEVEDVLEAPVRDERRPRAAALEQRVRGDRRAVREAVHRPGADGLRSRDDGLLLARGGRDLGRANRPSATSTASVKVPPTSIPSARMRDSTTNAALESPRRAPPRLRRTEPSNGPRRAAGARRRARARRRALPGRPRARRAADVLPRGAVREADHRRRGRARRARRGALAGPRRLARAPPRPPVRPRRRRRRAAPLAGGLRARLARARRVGDPRPGRRRARDGARRRDGRAGARAALPLRDRRGPPSARGDGARRESRHCELDGARAGRRGAR